MHHPRTRTTTETFSWQWPCGAACKMERQVTISCPLHGCRCWHGTPSPSTGHHPHHTHHHQHQQQEGTRALAAEEESNSGSRTVMNPAAPVVVTTSTETEFWVPDPYLMVQQLREFESLNDEVVALRVQLEEFKEEIEKSKKDNDGRNWFLALPDNVRNVLVMARDAISSYIAISAPPAK